MLVIFIAQIEFFLVVEFMLVVGIEPEYFQTSSRY